MVRFACKNCKYKFNAESNMLNRPCPYCGNSSVIIEQSVEDIISEVD